MSSYEPYGSTLRHDDSDNRYGNNEPRSSGYVTVRMKEEPPIFAKKKTNLNLPQDIVHMVVSNNWLMCLMSHQVLLRLLVTDPSLYDEVSLEKYLNGLKVSNIFLDPTGNHLLLSLVSQPGRQTNVAAELLYLHRNSTKPKRIDKFRDMEITSVAFNYDNASKTTTGPILVGTSKGLIFETEFGIDGDKMYQSLNRQVYDIGRNENRPISGIQFFRVPNTTRYIVFVATLNRLYTFQEILKPDEKNLQNIFTAYLSTPEAAEHYIKLKTENKLPKLRFSLNSSKKYPAFFACSDDSEILYGEVDEEASTVKYISSTDTVAYPSDLDYRTQGEQRKITPNTFVLTDFHAMLLYSDHVAAISLLNKKVVYEEYFAEQYGKLLNIIRDTVTGAVYLYCPRLIFCYTISNEQRNVWKAYLDRNEFELAKKYCRDNPAHMDHVLCKQAEQMFKDEDYIPSALMYSQTQTSFERVCLKFLSLVDKKPLMLFLRNRLENLSPNDKTQITMLVIWMVELYLTEIARYGDDSAKVKQLQKEFDNFMNLRGVDECIRTNRSVIYDLMGSHGDSYNLTALTTVNKDYESVINQYINQNNFSDALSILRSQNKLEFYYKYCPILMENIAHETISAIIAHGKRLDPVKLLPTMICSSENDSHIPEVIRYLEYAVHSLGTTDKAIHNFLIKMYAQNKPDKLKTYLETQGCDTSFIHYDVHYALRTCEEHEMWEASVFLQCLLQLWHPAVELALKHDSKLAQETASQPTDKELQRKLWLKIAEHEIKGKNDVKKALELLKKCDLLRIEDLLPFFSDFQKIDDFKEAICDALKEYNIKIQEQQRDMDESAESAERVRNDLQTFRNRSITIGAQEQCAICEVFILIKPFFIFSCGHKFHGDCLEKQIIPLLTPEQNRKLSNLKQQLENMLSQNQNEMQSDQTSSSSREQIKFEIENILASDCLFCGVMIDTIDQPFIEDWEQVKVDWQ